ncbi:hypothetical protein B0H13DRAFT_1884186 [Mycena leptocephala]|nr:hypothetical protein B0H13DRAFT_1884186 [Mycena leptocephala]
MSLVKGTWKKTLKDERTLVKDWPKTVGVLLFFRLARFQVQGHNLAGGGDRLCRPGDPVWLPADQTGWTGGMKTTPTHVTNSNMCVRMFVIRARHLPSRKIPENYVTVVTARNWRNRYATCEIDWPAYFAIPKQSGWHRVVLGLSSGYKTGKSPHNPVDTSHANCPKEALLPTDSQ